MIASVLYWLSVAILAGLSPVVIALGVMVVLMFLDDRK